MTPMGRWHSINPRIGAVAEVLLSGEMEKAGYAPGAPLSILGRSLVRLRFFFYRCLRRVPGLFRRIEVRVVRPMMKRLSSV